MSKTKFEYRVIKRHQTRHTPNDWTPITKAMKEKLENSKQKHCYEFREKHPPKPTPSVKVEGEKKEK